MELTHQFSVPSGLDETWAHFQDVSGLAGCFPGATVTSVDGDEFTGSCKVKLGPIALVYNGAGTFTERDEAAHRLVVDAKGKDKRGNGTAAAAATLTMAAGSGGGTDVSVVTELSITGKPAQFGRGLIQDVSDKLLSQFVTCLEQRLTAPNADDPPAPESTPLDNGAGATPNGGGAPNAGGPSSGGASGGAGPSSGGGASGGEALSEGEASGVGGASSESRDPGARPAPGPAATGGGPAPPPAADTLDLGATVLPILLRNYWKPAVAALAVLAILIRLLRRR